MDSHSPPLKTADYIIVGGGTSGLVMANLLSEDPTVSILVLESGPNRAKDSYITDLMAWLKHPAGHVLGGSSAINSLVFVPPSAAGLNTWEQMGNPGWNWQTFNQKYAYTSKLVLERPTVGTRPYTATINPNCAQRSSADVTYSAVAAQHPNLTILTAATVHRIMFNSPAVGDRYRAAWILVEITDNPDLKLVRTNRKIVLAAGVFQTPKLLELNRGVGANMQNHLIAIIPCLLSRISEIEDLNPGFQALAFIRLNNQKDLRLLDQFLSSERSATSGRTQAIELILANLDKASACIFLSTIPGPVALFGLIPCFLLSQAVQYLSITPSLHKFFDRGLAPTEASLEITKAAVRKKALTTHHTCGSVAILPLEKKKVVYSTLTVYGTTNLRVVDASIFPLMPHANPMATVYAVAERAADILKSL
ncbi:FAD/NAD(P)-binding domain-containing protein [Aspergillus fijiensis CBS 313.89]|uniref:glucose oxidase n=1 Tax=Aspergillus fijiensis CBS 313.89 TaxID=1448319 RepID=A0A8G1RDV9_9EURO|nr:FAD/NAD(P)-binding domain-containing protein [Aspergillus fijiensis CBS 313.89]RAK70978.1 FAD/NAD(P)-binding domain-containing protein [Aspergillus fijiensis CBS 313.89]